MTDERKKDFRECTESDPVLCQLLELSMSGWPSKRKHLSPEIRPYWSLKEFIKPENGLLFYKDRLIVPVQKRNYTLSKIHEGHQGELRCKLALIQSFFWFGMNQEMVSFVRKCDACQKFAPSNKRQPLLTHKIPLRPFQDVSMDIAEYNSVSYLILVDHFSKWLEIKRL